MPDLRAHMTACRLSVRELAALLNAPAGTVYRWVSGTAAPPADVAQWLERAARAIPRHLAAIDRWHRDNPPPRRD